MSDIQIKVQPQEVAVAELLGREVEVHTHKNGWACTGTLVSFNDLAVMVRDTYGRLQVYPTSEVQRLTFESKETQE